MARDEYYDFNYQEALYFEEPKILKAGDSLTMECDYATEDRDKITPVGFKFKYSVHNTCMSL